MRVTTRMFYDRFLSDFQSNMEDILKTQEQISSGKRINRPSDDPASLLRITGYKTQISRIGEYRRSITTANSMIGSLDKVLLNLSDTLNRARELGLQGADASSTGPDRLLIAKEIAALFEHVIDIANTKVGDRYIFSGYKSDTAPIDKNTGEFVGDSNPITLNISANTEIKLNVSASDLFSFKRVNPSDSANLVLPSYNVDKTGAYASTDEIYEDADPNGALHTDRFVVRTGVNDEIAGGTNGDATPDFTATLTAGTYTPDEMADEIKSALEAANGSTDTYTVSYDSTSKKFKIVNDTGNTNVLDLLWGDAATTAERLLGFNPENTLSVAVGSSDISDSSVTGGGFTASTNIFSTSGGTLTIKVGDDDATTAVDVSIPALATLEDVRNAINNANAGVKAEVVNVSTTPVADYRIVIASDPAGRSGDVRVTATSDDAAGTGLHTLVYMASNDTITINSSNNQIIITEAGFGTATATIATGTYTADRLAGAVKAALEGATASANTYTVVYDSTNKKFKIISDSLNTDDLSLLWSDSNTTAATVLGFDATDTTNITANNYDISDNALTYGVQNQTLGTDITNYNYITNPSNDNYYSFNNNYLNETNILRALNFLKLSLENNDAGRVEKAIDYLTKVSDRLLQIQADIGSRMNKLETEETYQVDREYEITTYMSNEQDTDIAKAITEMTQKQTALEGLRTISSNILRTSLFDFIQ